MLESAEVFIVLDGRHQAVLDRVAHVRIVVEIGRPVESVERQAILELPVPPEVFHGRFCSRGHKRFHVRIVVEIIPHVERMARIAAFELSVQFEVPKGRDNAVLDGRPDVGIIGEVFRASSNIGLPERCSLSP